jgi:tetratricopeptide (TPR) repeat protein
VFAWLALAALALAVRRRYSVPAFAVFWYLGGHALESTVLPLELYFEHRNYLPLLGAAFALAWGIMRLWERASSVASRRTYAAVAVLAATTFGAITFLELRTWADPVGQAAVWASERPHSTRAQYALGTLYLTHRQYGEAQRVFLAAEKAQPKEVQFILARAYIGCFVQDQWKPDWPEVVMRLQSGNISPLVYEFLTGMTDQLEEKQCPSLSPQIVRDLVDAVLANPRAKLSAYQWAGWYIKGRTYALEGQLDPAIRALEAADAVQPNLGVLHDQVTWLASAGLHDQALRFIERSRKDSRWRLSQRLHYDNIFDAWERDLREAGRLGRP